MQRGPLGLTEVFVYVLLKTNTGGQISCQGINVRRLAGAGAGQLQIIG